VAVGAPFAHGADSTVRILGSREEAKPTVSEVPSPKREASARRDSGVKRESTVRVATATSPVLGRQESKLVERRSTAPTAQADDFTKAISEAAALRNAIKDSTPANTASGNKAVANRTAPPANISALTISKPANAPSAMVHTPAPIAAAPSTVVPTPHATVPAPSPTVRAPAPLVPAPSNVVRAPAPVVPAPAPVALPPTPIADEPVLVARVPATVIHTPTTSPEPVASVAATHATYHPHEVPAPPANTHGETSTCPCDGAPEEYNLSNGMGCAYGPGQSGAQYICGVDCGVHGAPCSARWHDAHCIPWSLFGPGEYVGPSRSEHVSNYYLRVNDLLTLTYINSRLKEGERYRLGVGDRLLIESSLDESLRREVQIQPDGEITLPIVGEVMAAGKTIKELRDDLTNVFKEAQREPQITVTPLDFNQDQVELIRAVTAASGSNGQSIALKVTPEGTIQVPGLGSVYVQGLTLAELRSELEARYAATFGAGLLLSPALTERATSYVFVGGEVVTPNRYTLEGPTTAMQAIALAGGWNIGGNLHQVVVFRRDENWCLKAIKIDVRAPLYGNDPCPVNDVWLRDNDLVIVPKSKILCATDVINLYMTRGVYAAFPVSFFKNLSNGSTIVAAP
jgi:polysaccharide export outer membrane protein